MVGGRRMLIVILSSGGGGCLFFLGVDCGGRGGRRGEAMDDGSSWGMGGGRINRRGTGTAGASRAGASSGKVPAPALPRCGRGHAPRGTRGRGRGRGPLDGAHVPALRIERLIPRLDAAVGWFARGGSGLWLTRGALGRGRRTRTDRDRLAWLALGWTADRARAFLRASASPPPRGAAGGLASPCGVTENGYFCAWRVIVSWRAWPRTPIVVTVRYPHHRDVQYLRDIFVARICRGRPRETRSERPDDCYWQ